MRTVLGIFLLAGLIAGLVWLNDYSRDDSGKSALNVAGTMPISVKLERPVQRDIIRTVQAPGEVEAFLEVDISAEVVAKILEMPVEEGDTVKEGQLLCRLDDVDYRARLRSAQAGVAKLEATVKQAQADLDKAERDLKRQVRLSESDATSALELADYRTTKIRATAALEIRRQELIEAQSALDAAQKNLEKTVITSPIDGIVSQRFAKAGEVVITGTMNNPGTRIMVISDLSKMQLRCRVDESDIPLVKTDQSAQIYLQSDMYNAIPGHVYRVAAKGTRQAGRDVVTFETLILVDSQDPRVKPGMNASVEIEVQRRENALTVPVQTVVHRRRKDLPKRIVDAYDQAVRESSTAEHRARQAEYIKVVFRKRGHSAQACFVQTGISDETSVEITDGLEPTDWVVTGPFRSLDQLKDGGPIKEESDGEPDKTPKKKTGDTSGEKTTTNENTNDDANEDSEDGAVTVAGG